MWTMRLFARKQALIRTVKNNHKATEYKKPISQIESARYNPPGTAGINKIKIITKKIILPQKVNP